MNTADPMRTDDVQGERLSVELELLAEMGRDFASSLDMDATLAHALELINDYVGAEGAALFLLDEAKEKLTCSVCIGATEEARAGADDILGLTLDADQGIIGRCVQNDRGEIVRDVKNDPSFYTGVDDATGFVTRSILCGVLSARGETLGAIELVNKRSADHLFSESDLTFLESLCASAALAIENARMAEALVEQEKVKRELELAAEIQRSLLPDPALDGPVQGINVPARTVSGDFFDFFTLPDGRIAFNLGDVSGKGMNAALLMAKTASLYRCLGKEITSPGRLLGRINAEICETSARGMFVTMAGGVYDPVTGKVLLANAGHEPPLIHTPDGAFVPVPADAPPIGISPYVVDDDGYPEVEIDLAGGALYIFTDGLTEGYRQDGTELGSDGVETLLTDHRAAPLRERLETVVGVLNWPGVTLRDDLTLLTVDDTAAQATRGDVDNDVADEDPDDDMVLMKMEFLSRADRLKVARKAVSESALLCGCSPDVVQDIVLAVDEALQNVIRHAYAGRADGQIILTMAHRKDDAEGLVVATIRDFAPPVDAAAIKPRDLDDVRPGGLGTHFIREVMDEVDFLPPSANGPGGNKEGNILRMVRRVA